MLKKTSYFITLLLSGIIFLSLKNDRTGEDDYSEQQKLLVKVIHVIEENHYAPQTIDDSFSKLLWAKYIDKLDPRKELFLLDDLEKLKKYETAIDDELHGTLPVTFVPSALKVYTQRSKEQQRDYNELLSKPFNFSVNEEIEADGSFTKKFAANAAGQREIRRKRLKYLVLENFLELKDQQAASKGGDSLKTRTDAELEVMARSKTKKRTEREFKTLTDNLDKDKQFSIFINVIARLMDPHTDYFPLAEAQTFNETMALKVSGIGVHMKEDGQGVKIADVSAGSPAWKSGQIQEDDIFMKVGEGAEGPMVDITGMSSTELVKLIRGRKGSVLRITLKKSDGGLKTVTLMRDEISADEATVRAAVIHQGNKKLGYVTFPLFYSDPDPNGKHCAVDMAKALNALKSEKVDGIIVDLRRNGGGSLKEVVDMIGLFVGAGPAVQVRGRGKDPVVLENNGTKQLYSGPLTVMVDELSASASEIFTGAMQDYHRGIVIGSTSSYGKGTVQRPFTLEKREYGAVKLTFEQFYRVSGESTQLNGIVPDIILPDVLEYQKIREKDNVAALPWDMVAPADYKPSTDNTNLATTEKLMNERVDKNPLFTELKADLLVSRSLQEKKISLNYKLFKALKDARKKISAQVSKRLKLPVGKEIDVRSVSLYQKGSYMDWLKKLSADIYIDQAVQTLSEISKS